ncbi:MAG: segregation/condensation protein A [Clostridiales bacterium]|nr:segregation/condensation protein A [Clostridiales bacterium]
MIEYKVKLQNFEGPFDLLYDLIEKAEVDIYDIPVAEITNQYLDYINKMDYLDLDNASEFILMAATLIQIKSKMLLPKANDADDETAASQDDPRLELVEKLLEYKKYKNISEQLKEMEKQRFDVFYKNAEIINDIEEDDILKNVSIDDIVQAFEDVLKRCDGKAVQNDRFRQVLTQDEYTVKDKIKEIRNIMELTNTLYFSGLFNGKSSRMEIIITFLAVLELMRLRNVTAYQERAYSDIIIKKVN